MSQKAFAEKSGLHRTYVSEVEHGRQNVTLISLASIAAALKTTVAELATGIENLSEQ